MDETVPCVALAWFDAEPAHLALFEMGPYMDDRTHVGDDMRSQTALLQFLLDSFGER